MYRYEDIKMVHLELTSRCNARCPMCARNIHGGKLNPQLPLTDLGLSDIKKIFPREFLYQLKKVYLCGNYGDPAAASETLEVVKYFRETNIEMAIGIHSNGGLQEPEWWASLAPLVSYCRFGIDGLEDTNHLYRQGVKWDRLINNVRAFVAAGGRAEWDYLVFKHNQHQVSEARELSIHLGFTKFQVKSTSRFFNSQSGRTMSAYEVQTPSGQCSHYLQPSDLPEYRNQALETGYGNIVDSFGSVQNYWDTTDIQCRTMDEKSIYVTAQGLVFPCCWTANQLYPSWLAPQKSQIWSFLGRLPQGAESLSALRFEIKDILAGKFFQEILPSSWQCKSINQGRLQVCAKTCGKSVKPFESQFLK